MKKTIAVLLTCYNRCEKTLLCLDELFHAEVPLDYEFSVFLVDDGSTDNTAESVHSQFPNVNIIEGSGDLFWNRGMHLAWSVASNQKPFDYYIWLNDDTIIQSNTVVSLINYSVSCENKAIICASVCALKGTNWTYGGYRFNSNKNAVPVIPTGYLEKCDLINGNCVLIPRFVFDLVGNLDLVFRHAIGDFDYGLRAIKKGLSVYATGEFLARCDNNPSLPQWCLQNTPFTKRVKSLYSPLGNSHPKLFFTYEYRHFGLFVAIKHFLSIHLRLLKPSLWKNN